LASKEQDFLRINEPQSYYKRETEPEAVNNPPDEKDVEPLDGRNVAKSPLVFQYKHKFFEDYLGITKATGVS